MFVVTHSTAGNGYSLMNAPSCNGEGDIVMSATTVTSPQKVIHTFRDVDQRTAGATVDLATTPIQVTAHPTSTVVASFPVINRELDVVFRRSDLVNQFIRVSTYSPGPLGTPGTYTPNNIAACSASILFGANQFVFLGPITAQSHRFGAVPTVFYYGEQQATSSSPLVRGIHGSSTVIPLTSPPPTPPPPPYASTAGAGAFLGLDQQVAASGNGALVFRATGATGVGIYAVRPGSAVPSLEAGPGEFALLGIRPTINDHSSTPTSAGVTAFYGEPIGGSPGVFQRFPTEPAARRAGSVEPTPPGLGTTPFGTAFGTLPLSYGSGTGNSRVASNDLNQVAYSATDAAGHPAIFSTNLGAVRRIVGVGDQIIVAGVPRTVTGLGFYQGITNHGDVVLRADYSGGSAVVRVPRAHIQGKSPSLNAFTGLPYTTPSHRSTQYLLRGIPGSGFASGRTIGGFGCNLTSTVNVMSFFGIDTTPIAFHDWLLAKYRDNQCSLLRCNYIDDRAGKNDFQESAVYEFTRELSCAGASPVVLRAGRPHKHTAASTNLARIVFELRNRRAVKLRVKGEHGPFGHYVMAYGLLDPTKADAAMTTSDILIHDPNWPRDRLSDYDAISAPNWLSDTAEPRVYPYEVSPTPCGPPVRDLHLFCHSPVEVVLTDSLGRRIGVDPAAGSFNTLPGAYYDTVTSYDSIADPAIGPSEPVWGTYDAKKILGALNLAPGTFTLEVIGTGAGPYEIVFATAGDLDVDMPLISGTTTVGQRDIYTLNVGAAPSIQLLAAAQIGATVPVLLSAATEGGATYIQGAALGTQPGIPVGARTVPLNLDPVLLYSLSAQPTFVGFAGALDPTGHAQTAVHVPPDPAIIGFTVHTAFLTLRAGAPSGIGVISQAIPITIVP